MHIAEKLEHINKITNCIERQIIHVGTFSSYINYFCIQILRES